MEDKSTIVTMELIKKDMAYVKADVIEMKTKLDTVLEKYVHREEMSARFDRVQTEIDKRFEGVNSRVDNSIKETHEILVLKVDKEDFKLYKNLFWTIVTAVSISIVFGGLYFGLNIKK
jgi:hypothetical protein